MLASMLDRHPLQPAHTIKRILLMLAVAVVLTIMFVALSAASPVYAADSAASASRHDRRPDRERPVVTSPSPQGGSSTGTTRAGNATTSQSRPRLVRR